MWWYVDKCRLHNQTMSSKLREFIWEVSLIYFWYRSRFYSYQNAKALATRSYRIVQNWFVSLNEWNRHILVLSMIWSFIKLIKYSFIATYVVYTNNSDKIKILLLQICTFCGAGNQKPTRLPRKILGEEFNNFYTIIFLNHRQKRQHRNYKINYVII